MSALAALLPKTNAADVALLDGLDGSVYAELMRLARAQLQRSGTMSLDAPSLVHETYLRLARQGTIGSGQRRVFYAYASRVMRTVVVDYVRERRAQKRGGNQKMITLTTGIPEISIGEDLIDLVHEAMRSLEKIDERAHLVVELRYFGGMTEEEIAALLEVSVPTIKRDWRKARAFLLDTIGSH